MTYKVIIAGGRDFHDYELMKRKLDFLFSKKANIEIVSGGARGADALGERYAKERNLPIEKNQQNGANMESWQDLFATKKWLIMPMH